MPSRLPAFCYVTMALDSAPGKYTLRVTATDQANKAKATVDHKFVVTDKGFGIVKVMATKAPKDSTIYFRAEGKDARAALDALVSLVNKDFPDGP